MAATIRIPTIQSGSPLLSTIGGDEFSDSLIELAPNLVIFLAQQIVDKEMELERKRNPTKDLSKIQAMLYSNDNELFNLALCFFDENCKYTANIFRYIKANDYHNLQGLISSYTIANKFNITEEVL